MKNILIPTDFSENSKNALRYAQVMFSTMECSFYVLYVGALVDSQTDTFGVSRPTGKDLSIDNIKHMLADFVDGCRGNVGDANHHFYTLQDYGFFIQSIKKNLEEHQIDLIVMGTKGASGLKERVVGSNAGDVITKVQCNTLVIPDAVVLSKPKEIAFPTDFNIFYTHGILSSMAEMLNLSASKLRIMNVIKKGETLTLEQKTNKEYLFDYMEETFPDRYSFHTITNKSVKTAIQSFVENQSVNMIVMVAKNLNFIQQILFDSIVEKISFHTRVPFYVIHE
ncbi:MAG: universal stress protein [Flavobacteriaceae bacterium]|jgi:nucleotide-binding universal stress UspA family protein|uniref:universal stress protein n=1 Tax=Flagellimonas sp. SN16 TaxID=3415142 RepID=UPI000E23C320|nr:universal stress protein [Flavobacteriaceae bacterium]